MENQKTFDLRDWVKHPTPDFDKKAVFQERIDPLMKQVLDIAQELDIPFHFLAAVSDDAEATGYAEYLNMGENPLIIPYGMLAVTLVAERMNEPIQGTVQQLVMLASAAKAKTMLQHAVDETSPRH